MLIAETHLMGIAHRNNKGKKKSGVMIAKKTIKNSRVLKLTAVKSLLKLQNTSF